MTNKPRIQVILTDEEYEKVRIISEETNLSISKTAEIIIKKGLEKIKETNKII